MKRYKVISKTSVDLTAGGEYEILKNINKYPFLFGKEILKVKNEKDNERAILLLVYLSTGNIEAKQEFKKIFNQVIIDIKDLYLFMEYVKGIRGFGKTINKTVKKWFLHKKVEYLTNQYFKYPKDDFWKFSDVLRKIKPIPRNKKESELFSFIVNQTKYFGEVSD